MEIAINRIEEVFARGGRTPEARTPPEVTLREMRPTDRLKNEQHKNHYTTLLDLSSDTWQSLTLSASIIILIGNSSTMESP